MHLLTVPKCLKDFYDKSDVKFSDYYAKLGSQSSFKRKILYRFEQVEIHVDYDLTHQHYENSIAMITVLIIIILKSLFLESPFNPSSTRVRAFNVK